MHDGHTLSLLLLLLLLLLLSLLLHHCRHWVTSCSK
jgi:hypothetical protein